MTLRKKTFLIFSIVLVLIIFITYKISNLILLKSFENMEFQYCERNVKMAFDNLNDEINQLKSVASDWSVWDDTYEFILNRNEEYIASNLADETFTHLKVNSMLFYDLKGNKVYEKGFDLQPLKEIVITDEFIDKINIDSKLLNQLNEDGCNGIISLKTGPAMVSSRPIVKSNGSGPSRGSYILIKKLDKQQIERFSRILHINLELKSINDTSLSKDFLEAKRNLLSVNQIFVAPLESKSVAGYKIVNDVFGKPSLILRVDVPRDIYNKGRQSSLNLILATLFTCLIFFLITLIIIERIIIRRLLKLSKTLFEIGESNNFSMRVPVQGGDELSALSGSINGMLGSLEKHIYQITERTEQVEATQSFLESVIDTVSAGICVFDIDGKILKYNSPLLSMIGYSTTDMNTKNIYGFFPHPFQQTLNQYKNELAKKGRIHFETYMCKRDMSTFPVEINATVLKDKSGRISSAVAVINNITERKISEHALRRKSDEQALLLDNIEIQIWYLTDPETYGSVNNAHALFLEMDKLFIQNQKISKICKNIDIANTYIKMNTETFISKKGKQFEIEYNTNTINNRVFHVSTTPKLDIKGDVEYVICTAEDITERKVAESKITYLSYHDKLTGLYNRAFFEDEFKRLDEEGVLPISIIIGDINGLKITNDVFGHTEGDKLLVRIANILKESCRVEDIIARWGGDEFAIILPYASEDTALEICKTISDKCIDTINNLIKSNIALGTSTRVDLSKDTKQMIKEAEERMYRHKLLENKSSRSSYVSLLEKALFERNYETEEHAQRMRQMSVQMGKAIGLPSNKLDELNLLAALHDIGKIAIPDNILLKAGPLTDEEYETMKKHPEVGYRIAVLSPELAPIAEAILTHHERWDGKGYPQGLKGEEIQVISRIISIVDTFDVMTNKRPYKDEVSKEDALNEIRRCAGTQFDPYLAEIFIRLVSNDT